MSENVITTTDPIVVSFLSSLSWSELVLVLQVIVVCIYVVFNGAPASQQSQTTEYKPVTAAQSETRQNRPARRRSRSATPNLQTPEREKTGQCVHKS